MHPLSKLGAEYEGDPLPAIAASTTLFVAGVVTFGVEERTLDPRAIEEAYRSALDIPESKIQELVLYAVGEIEKAGEQDDGGVSIHVTGTGTTYEYLRFDCFDDDPHYHYLVPGISNVRVQFDAVANGSSLSWALERLRTRLPEMLTATGSPEAEVLAVQVDAASVVRAIGEVEEFVGKLADNV